MNCGIFLIFFERAILYLGSNNNYNNGIVGRVSTFERYVKKNKKPSKY